MPLVHHNHLNQVELVVQVVVLVQQELEAQVWIVVHQEHQVQAEHQEQQVQRVLVL